MLRSSSPASSAALGWMKSLNSTSVTRSPSLAATLLTTSPICACGPTVTPTFNSASCARAGAVAILNRAAQAATRWRIRMESSRR
ncbi:Uncharacterised protein [Bordetella pertussis]|nr:Uncharacterised protein [Bordetella pertussis]